MDLASILGIAFALTACLGSVVLEGGHIGALVNIPAAVIVFGGTFGATVVGYRLGDILRLPLVLKQAFFNAERDPVEVIRKIVDMARLARREGFLGLEKRIAEVRSYSPFLARALQMVADGTSPEVVSEVLGTNALETRCTQLKGTEGSRSQGAR